MKTIFLAALFLLTAQSANATEKEKGAIGDSKKTVRKVASDDAVLFDCQEFKIKYG